MNESIWAEICFLLNDKIKSDISENDFEQNVLQALQVLNWKEFLGEIEVRPSFQVGASNRIIPDFVIKSENGTKLFVIEIKQPNIPLNTTFQQQLFSYMRQLKLEYGILIGQGIQVFYDGPLSHQEDPLLIESLKFTKQSSAGISFVKLFNKNNFDKKNLDDFTKEVLKKINKKKEFKTLKNKILNKEFNENIKSLVKQEFIGEYDGEMIDSVLEEVEFNIIDTILAQNSLGQSFTNDNSKPSSSSFNLTKRIFNSKESNPKSQNKIYKDEQNQTKIGQLVKSKFKQAYDSGLISETEINNLQKKEYSKRVFNSNFEVL